MEKKLKLLLLRKIAKCDEESSCADMKPKRDQYFRWIQAGGRG